MSRIFRIDTEDSSTSARAGVITTAHGEIPTPCFMPVGTGGTVKGVLPRDLKEEVGAGIILGNTYHLYLRPGTSVIQQAGGLHRFMNWDRPILTDSGGYQVFSLAANRKLTEEGAVFKSHIDGSKHFFTPENVMEIQRNIGADIIMAFDECTSYPADHKTAEKSMHLTHRWLDRCIGRFSETEPVYGYDQFLLPIVQGSTYADLRRLSAEVIASKEMEGNAIGGLSVGEPAEIMYEMIEVVNEILPEAKPRYLMGVGTPVNILEAIERGIDMFDCVMPTRNGRNGMLFTTEGIINIRNRRWMDDFSPIDAGIPAGVSNNFSRAYLRHLVISGELLGLTLASIHNLSFYLWLTGTAREKIISGTFAPWKREMVERLSVRVQ
ncbi:MAG: tRNA guanosine(34) transglycosylase Tgt [Bacteroidales bacterium]